MCACTVTHMWRLDGNLRELFLSSHHVGSGHLVWVVRLVASTFTLSSLLFKKFLFTCWSGDNSYHHVEVRGQTEGAGSGTDLRPLGVVASTFPC